MKDRLTHAARKPVSIAGDVDVTELLATYLALDCLLRSVQASHHRIWVARRSVLEAAGGTWHPAWAVARPGTEEGGMLVERSWGARPGCPACAVVGSC